MRRAAGRRPPALGAVTVTVAVATLVVTVLLVSDPVLAGGEGTVWRYRPPVHAPVSDPYRPPPAPWLPGNRGIEYRTPPGSVVRAIGPGTVSFAGRVAGTLVVTVRHPDGLRSSYVHLAVRLVRVGRHVRGGEPVGRSTERLHLGVRRGRTYLDPASLWGRSTAGHVVLVPTRPLGTGAGRHYHRPSAHRPVSRSTTPPVRTHGRASSLARDGPGSRQPMGRSGP